jgi:hypothetical protein
MQEDGLVSDEVSHCHLSAGPDRVGQTEMHSGICWKRIVPQTLTRTPR